MKISKFLFPKLLLLLSFFVLCSNFSIVEKKEEKKHFAYTTSQNLKTITPIDLETGEAGCAIELEFTPKEIVVSEKIQKAYILQQDSNQIISIDLQTGTLLDEIILENNPKQMVMTRDGLAAYILSEDSNELILLDLKTETSHYLTSFNNAPQFITLSTDGKTLYALSYGTNEITAIDLESIKEKASIFISEEPVTFAVTTDGQMASVGHNALNQLNFFNIETGSLDSSLTLEDDQNSIAQNIETIHMSHDGQKAYLTHENSKLITPINLKEMKADKSITTAHNIQSFALIERQNLIPKDESPKKEKNPLSELDFSLVQTETTTTSLLATPDPSAFGQSVTLTATVATLGPGTPTGTVDFFEGATLLGSGTLSGSIATFSTSTFAVGSHTLTAVYNGDLTFFPSTSAPITQVVNQGTTSTAVTSSLNPSRTGQNVTFTATVTVTAGVGSPTGTVTFNDGATTLGTGTVAGGVATFATSTLTVSSHPITAVYNGDVNFATSTSTILTQVVNQGITTTAVTSSANPSIFGNSITLTATLTVTAGIGTPTGNVTFKDGATTIGTGTVAAGVATFSTSILSVGSHSITAVYNGDINFSASTSPLLTQVVNQGATSTTVVSSLNPSTYGASVTFTSTTVVTTGAGTLTGTVTFFDGLTNLGNSPINVSGVATLTTANLSVGSHPISAVYNGNINFLTSTSAIITQVVEKATPLVTLASSLNPSIFGDTITFTGTVNAPTILGLPTGTLSFYDGATLIGTGTLIPTGPNTSQATFTISTLIASTHPITAEYSGDSNFIYLTSAILNQVVSQAMTTTTALFSNSPNPTQFGQPVILQATVTGSVVGAPFPPTGTVIFYDGVTILGSATLSTISTNISTVTFTTTTLAIGSHNITAQYQGDTNYPGSTSPIFVQNVIKTGTTSLVTSSVNPSVVGQTVTFTSTVSGSAPGMGNASGPVSFYDGVNLLGTGTLVSTGPNTSIATFSTSALMLGSHRIFSIYTGDTNFTSSTSPLITQIVSQDTTTTLLASSLNPSNFGDLITLTATPTANPPGSGTPTGSVQFFDGATFLATRPLIAGTANYSSIALYPGTHSLTAIYSGDSNFITSTSAPLAQVVNNQLPTITAITSSRNSSPTAQAVTYSARVTAITGIPTGTVTFYDLTNSSLPIGTGTLVNGVATITEPGTSLILLGVHQIEAVYNGDANFITSTSPIFNQYVVPLDTTITLTTNPNPSQQANATFTANVTIIGGSGPLTGNVTFYEDGVLIPGTVTFNPMTGIATINPNNLHFGAQNITAIYSGDTTTFAMATSNTVIQQVQQTDALRTNVILTSSLSTAYYCQLVNLTANVTEIEGFYTPTGYVTFFSDDIEIGGAYLNSSGVAVLPITTLPIGAHVLTAAYNTDNNYSFSKSNNVNINISPNNTTTTLSLIPNLAVTPYTQNIFFSARVTSDFAIATGSVSFYDGINLLHTIDLDATGQAAYETSTLESGIHTITAVYNEDPCFFTSSTTLTHTISKISPVMTYTGTPNPSIYNQDILLKATLTFTLNGFPTGTITFYNGLVVVGSAELVNGIAYFNLTNVPAGVVIIRGTYSGDNNFLSVNLPSFVQRINKASTTTCLNSYSTNPTQYGEVLTFNATVSSEADGIAPTGSIVFRNESTIIGTVPLTGCNTATLDTSNLNLGTNNITALYSGDSNYNSSTSNTYVQNIVMADTKTTVVSSTPNPSIFNSLVTFNISVDNLGTGLQVPTGTVTGFYGSTVIGSATLANGVASFSTSALPAGVDTIIVKYSGDTNFNASTIATTQTVTTLATNSVLTSSNNPSVAGQPVTLSVNVTSTGGTPTGTISFLNGTVTLGTATLNTSGQASITVSNLSVATHSIRAIYSGSANLSGSTSNTISQVVNKAATTTALSSTNNPSSFGENITFNAFVAATAPGTGIPTGSVTFRNGATTIGTGTLNAAGMATFTISSLSVGSSPYAITALYAGDVNYLTSTSAILSEVVTKTATITTATATPNPANLGNSVTLNVSVAAVKGIGIPTGTVTAYYGSTVVGSATLNGLGQATFSSSTLPSGTLAIVVQYGGDANYLASSTTVTERITQNSSTTTLSSSINPSTISQTVTFSATVTSSSGVPTGIVAFFDGTSPLGSVTLNGSAVATFITSSLGLGTHPITAVYSGDVNNLVSTSNVVNQVVNQASTTTTLTSFSNPSEFGNPVTFTALTTPSNSNSLIPTGTVTFRNGLTTIGTVNVNSLGTASFTLTSLPIGANSITAVYNGDLNFTTSTSAILTQQVNKTDTKIIASTAPNPSSIGSPTTLSIAVSPINTTGIFPSGTVNAFYGSTLLGTATLNGTGQATITTTALPAGTLGIMINYLGDTNFNPSNMTVTQTVNQSTSTNILTSSLNPSVFGQAVTFTTTVTSSFGTPTGTATFYDGTSIIGVQTLNGSGIATLTLSSLTLGTHPISVVYGGSASIAGSTSNTANQVVNQSATVTTVLSSLNSSTYLNQVTFTAQVLATPPGSGIPTGTVTFKDGATIIGVTNINSSASASFTTSSLLTGTHSITAVYSGDTNYTTSTSSVLSQAVNLANTATTILSSTPNPSMFGEVVTFFAAVTSVEGTASGTISFFDGATLLGTVPVIDGLGIYATPILSIGTHTITATYSGNSNFNPSTSAPIAQVVNQTSITITTVTTLTSDLNPSNYGDLVTFDVTVTPIAGPGFPTGIVTIYNGSNPLATLTLVAGQASYSTSTLPAGTLNIVALYSGDSAFSASTSTIIQVVNPFSTTTILTSSLNPSNFMGSVTFTANVSSASLVVPTGSVLFYDGATIIGAALLNGLGDATFTTSNLTTGSHVITATYSAHPSFMASSDSLTQIVNPALTTTVVLLGNPNSSKLGETVVFIATTISGTSNISGTLTFYDGATPIGTATLYNSLALFSTSTLPVGTHSITAVFSGNTDFAPSTSAPYIQVVNPATFATTTSLSSSINPSQVGESVVFTATVTSPSGTPTGTVSFFDGATSIGTVVLNGSGLASLTTSTLAQGNHSITAIYSGDSSFGPSTSPVLIQVVGASTTPNAPQDFRGCQVANKFLNETCYKNRLTWDPPLTGATPTSYRIYSDVALTKLVAEVPGTEHHYDVLQTRKNKTYRYSIVAVNGSVVSAAATTTVYPNNQPCRSECD